MNCLLNVFGYMIFIPVTLLYKALSYGEEESPPEDSSASQAPD